MKKLSNILLYGALVLSGIYTVLLALGAFGVIGISSIAGSHYNYIWAFVIVLAGLALYIAFMFIEKIRNLIVPSWFKCLFYLAFFVFTNIYYLFSLYHTLAGMLVFDIYLAVILNIGAVSLFYNTQKDVKNIVKTTDKFLVFSCFAYSTLGVVVYELISLIIKVATGGAGILFTLPFVVSELAIMLCVNFVFAIVFTVSLKKTKAFINGCLIKYNVVSDYKTNKDK